MATAAQVIANRENAQHSTGPITEAGRETVSQNSTRHGLTGAYQSISDAEAREYSLILKNFITDYNVTTDSEIELVSKMAEAYIRSNRAGRLMDASMDVIEFGDEEDLQRARKEIELFTRYQAHHDRAFQRYAAELRKYQSENRKAAIGFVSQKRQEAQETRREAQEIRAQAQETRRENDENRRRQLHEVVLALAQARLNTQLSRNRKLPASTSPEKSPEDLRSVA